MTRLIVGGLMLAISIGLALTWIMAYLLDAMENANSAKTI